jgi:acyl carrier protein
MTDSTERLETLRDIVSTVLELEPGELSDTGDFAEDYDADSLRAIELLARIEKHFKIDLPQTELPNMANLKAVDEIVARYSV